MMNEKPILFSGEMIRAILAGEKTQTRRVITKCGPYSPTHDYLGEWIQPGIHSGPYGKPGDRLWVRETFAELCELADPYCECEDAAPDNPHHLIEYRADSGNKYPGQWDDAYPDEIENAREEEYLPRWKPSIFMPRWASRIQLKVESVRVERLQDISPRDAVREGVVDFVKQRIWKYHAIIENFKEVWNSINEDRGYGWDENPWVWVVEFLVIAKEDA